MANQFKRVARRLVHAQRVRCGATIKLTQYSTTDNWLCKRGMSQESDVGSDCYVSKLFKRHADCVSSVNTTSIATQTVFSRLCPKTPSERPQPRSGDIFVEQRGPVSPSSGGAAYHVAHKWAKSIKESFLSTNISCLTALKTDSPSLQFLPTPSSV
jgi:hypothetical protein